MALKLGHEQTTDATRGSWSRAEDIARRLGGTKARRSGANWSTCCPAHADRKPSLSIGDGVDGRLLVFCHRGCSYGEIIAALISRGIDVHAIDWRAPSNGGNRQRREPVRPTKGADPIAKLEREGFRVVIAYPYHDEDGALLYENVRLEKGHNGTREKTFRQRAPIGGNGWTYSLSNIRRVPYRLPDLVARTGENIHVTEGEKDADRLRSLGLLATSIAAPGKVDLQPFRGRRVYIHEDNDEAGRQKSANLREAITGTASHVVVVQYADAGPGGDVSDWLDHGRWDGHGDALNALLQRCAEYENNLPDVEPFTDAHTAHIEFADDVQLDTSANYVIKGLISAGSSTILFGPSTAGKTFFALDLALHVALGRSFWGRRTKKCSVLYVALEGQGSFGKRVVAACSTFGSNPGRLFGRLKPAIVLGRDPRGAEGVAQIVTACEEVSKQAEHPVGLVVIDTLTCALAGDNENEAAAISAVMAQVGQISSQTGAAVILVHHPGKDQDRGPRGSSALFAAVDAAIKIERDGDDLRSVTLDKHKDGAEGPIGTFRLRLVDLGNDADGDPITSCIVVHAGNDAQRVPRRPPPNSGAGKALNELEHLLAGSGVPSSGHDRVPDGVICASKDDWQAACRAKGLSSGNPDSEQRVFRRAVSELESRGVISIYGDHVWCIRTDKTRMSGVHASLLAQDIAGHLSNAAAGGEFAE